jgi:uncharacterized protein
LSRIFSRGEVFVDSAALIAMIDSRDALHDRARVVERRFAESDVRMVMSDAVLSEFLSLTSPRPLRAAGIAAVDAYMNSPRFTVVPATRRAFLRAVDLYRSRPDKEWSLVDCSSILICQERGIRRVFTSDRHFRQAGFDILLP